MLSEEKIIVVLTGLILAGFFAACGLCNWNCFPASTTVESLQAELRQGRSIAGEENLLQTHLKAKGWDLWLTATYRKATLFLFAVI